MNAETTIKASGLDLLRVDFPAHQISKLPKETKAQSEARKNNREGVNCEVCGGWHHPRAVHLDYVGHAALTDRLLDADPHWYWEPVAFNEQGLPAFDRTGGLWIKLTVCGVTRLGYGCADGKQGGDAVKEIIGDALRNAAMRFGAALDLWHKGDLHLEPEGEAEGHSLDSAVSPPPADKPAPWREPESIYSTPTKLHKALTQLERELHGCGDSAMVYALCNTDDWREFAKIADKHAPHYLHGGPPAPEEFEGLLTKAERMVREFDTAEANHRAALARN